MDGADEVTLRALEKEDIPQAVAIAGEAFGEGYVDRELLERSMEEGSRYCTDVAVAGDTVVGFSIAVVHTLESIGSYLHVAVDELPRQVSEADKIGVVRTAAVREVYRRQGIGTRLADRSMERCREEDVDVLLAVAWKPKGAEEANAGRMLRKIGFEKAVEVEEYWKEYSRGRERPCPVCGDICECDAVIFLRV